MHEELSFNSSDWFIEPTATCRIPIFLTGVGCACCPCLLVPSCRCTAFIIEITVNPLLRPGTCKLIYGKTELGEFKRSMTRTDIGRLTDISGNLL